MGASRGENRARRAGLGEQPGGPISGNIGSPPTNSDNSRVVVRGADFAVLDGFIIQDEQRGAACGVRSPHRACAARAPWRPSRFLTGAIAAPGFRTTRQPPSCATRSSQNCRAGKGGGVYNMTATAPGVTTLSPVFINVTIRNNYAGGRGAGMMNDLAAPTRSSSTAHSRVITAIRRATTSPTTSVARL